HGGRAANEELFVCCSGGWGLFGGGLGDKTRAFYQQLIWLIFNAILVLF
ncbi:MAG: hypothetical protein RLY14_2197, partial [Planctomycetota bacterium]